MRPRRKHSDASATTFFVSTGCLYFGYHFESRTQGHGKMVVRSGSVQYLFSPHVLNERGVVWANDYDVIVIHFDHYKYGRGSGSRFNDVLRNFTLALVASIAH